MGQAQFPGAGPSVVGRRFTVKRNKLDFMSGKFKDEGLSLHLGWPEIQWLEFHPLKTRCAVLTSRMSS
jgi:hypothetical protein